MPSKNAVFDTNGFRAIRTFRTKAECRKWGYEGLMATDGAERDHYVSMLSQLDEGWKSLAC